MKQLLKIIVTGCLAALLIGCTAGKDTPVTISRTEAEQETLSAVQEIPTMENESVLPLSVSVNETSKARLPGPASSFSNPVSLLHPEGMTLETRVLPPEGYSRPDAEEESLTAWLRNYPMKEHNTEVLLYDGSPKRNQSAHAAVFGLPIEEEDLQQCADSVMRMYAEYLWSRGQYDQIAFHFTNGFLAEYSKWREGYRIQVSGNDVYWIQSGSFDDSYENFQRYLRMVFCYAGTLSMVGESEEISLDQAAPGDVFLYGGSPGHVVMIADICQDSSGRKAYLLAQGYMPAQEFHVLKNPIHEDDPWYYEDEIIYPLRTPEYTFQEGSLRRLDYGGTVGK